MELDFYRYFSKHGYGKFFKFFKCNFVKNIEFQISWEKRFDNASEGQTCFCSIDGVDFKILEPKPFNRKWYNHKFHGPGVRYEIALCIQTGNIVWMHGGYPCGEWPDLKIARESYVHMLHPKERSIADKGYKDEFFLYYRLRRMANCING